MIQYRHRNCDKAFTPATFAYDLPPASFFDQAFSEGINIVNFPFGVTIVHPNDNYCKAIGRNKALSLTKTTQFEIINIRIVEGRQKFTLLSQEIRGRKYILGVSTKLNDDLRSRLDYIDIDDPDLNW